MRRTILTSMLVVGAALAIVFGGAATFAPFTDTENIEGTVTAAILDFELDGDGGNTGVNEAANDEILTITFDNTGVLCGFAFFAPGKTCTIPVTLTRPTPAQQLAANLTVTAFNVGATNITDGGAGDLNPGANAIGLDCDGAGEDWTISWIFVDTDGSATHMPAGVADTNQRIDVTVSLASGAGNGCQNSTAPNPIDITITSTQDPVDPYTATD